MRCTFFYAGAASQRTMRSAACAVGACTRLPRREASSDRLKRSRQTSISSAASPCSSPRDQRRSRKAAPSVPAGTFGPFVAADGRSRGGKCKHDKKAPQECGCGAISPIDLSARTDKLWPSGVARAYPLGSGKSGDTEPARMEVRHGTNVHPRSELLLLGEGIGFPLERVTRINPAIVRPRAGNPDLSDTGDRGPANVPQHSDPRESRPSRTEPDDGSCSSDALRREVTPADGGHSSPALFIGALPTVLKQTMGVNNNGKLLLALSLPFINVLTFPFPRPIVTREIGPG